MAEHIYESKLQYWTDKQNHLCFHNYSEPLAGYATCIKLRERRNDEIRRLHRFQLWQHISEQEKRQNPNIKTSNKKKNKKNTEDWSAQKQNANRKWLDTRMKRKGATEAIPNLMKAYGLATVSICDRLTFSNSCWSSSRYWYASFLG